MQRENLLRGDSPVGVNSRKKVCMRNHDNWKILGSGKRRCLDCYNAYRRELRKRKREGYVY